MQLVSFTFELSLAYISVANLFMCLLKSSEGVLRVGDARLTDTMGLFS